MFTAPLPPSAPIVSLFYMFSTCSSTCFESGSCFLETQMDGGCPVKGPGGFISTRAGLDINCCQTTIINPLHCSPITDRWISSHARLLRWYSSTAVPSLTSLFIQSVCMLTKGLPELCVCLFNRELGTMIILRGKARPVIHWRTSTAV